MTKASTIGPWHFWSLAAVLIAGGLLVWSAFEVFGNNSNIDKSLAIIGAILPSVVAIGAAVFGISAFKAGTQSGAEAGEARAEAAASDRDLVVARSTAAIDRSLARMEELSSVSGQSIEDFAGKASEELSQLRTEING